MPREIMAHDVQRLWRAGVGGMWDALGKLQFEFLMGEGLRPEHSLLDVGCGSLRGGVRFAEYLHNGNYYGIDKNMALLEFGRHCELAEHGLSNRRVHLLCREDFDFSHFGKMFDFAIAQSVFTHIPNSSILHCLLNMKKTLKTNGRFYATFFEAPEGSDSAAPMRHAPAGILTYAHQDPYHYKFSTIETMVRQANMKVQYLGDWDHPRGQKMLRFTHPAD